MRHRPCWRWPPAVAAALPANQREERSIGRAGVGRLRWRRRSLPTSEKSAAPAVLSLAPCGGGGAPCRLAGRARHRPCWRWPPAVAAEPHANRREERYTGRARSGRLRWRRHPRPTGGKSAATAVLALAACGCGSAACRPAGRAGDACHWAHVSAHVRWRLRRRVGAGAGTGGLSAPGAGGSRGGGGRRILPVAGARC